MPKLLTTIAERISSSITKDSAGCWNWLRHCDRHGYGRIKANGKDNLAHRLSYETFCGSIPQNMTIDHKCLNTRCVNPDHMQIVSASQNASLAQSRKTHCRHGHEFNAENTYFWKGVRHCRACNRAAKRNEGRS